MYVLIKGYEIRTLISMMLDGIRLFKAYHDCALTGITVWLSSGIVPTLIYYGLDILSIQIIYFRVLQLQMVAVVMGLP